MIIRHIRLKDIILLLLSALKLRFIWQHRRLSEGGAWDRFATITAPSSTLSLGPGNSLIDIDLRFESDLPPPFGGRFLM